MVITGSSLIETAILSRIKGIAGWEEGPNRRMECGSSPTIDTIKFAVE